MMRNGSRPTGFAAWLLLATTAVSAQPPVYECRGADGAISYQDRACAASSRERVVAIAPAPAYAPSPEYRVPEGAADPPAKPARKPARDAVSWECRADNGEVFYRHSRCPGSIPVDRRDAHGEASVRVRAMPMPRKDACRRMHAAGRVGRDRDERASTYERNLGRDPCRRP